MTPRQCLLSLSTAGVAIALAFSGGCSSSTPAAGTTTPSCSFTPTASTTTFAAAGGTGTVTVNTAPACAWTAASNAAFITITGGAAGSGSGTVTFVVASNSGAARTGTVVVAGTTFTVSQSAGAGPAPGGTLAAPTASSPVNGVTVTVSRPTLVVNNAVSTGTVGKVTYRFEISDTATFPNDAVRTFTGDGIDEGAGGTTSWTLTRDLGNDVLWYWHARATNGSITSDYSATATFRTPTTCIFSASPSTLSVGSSASTSTIAVTASTSSCAWTAASNASFISVTSGSSGSGSGSVTLSIAANGASSPRTGTVTIAGQTVTIIQAPLPPLTQVSGCGGQAGAPAGSTSIQFINLTSAPLFVSQLSGSNRLNTTRVAAQAGLSQSTIVGAVWVVEKTLNDCFVTVTATTASGSVIVRP